MFYVLSIVDLYTVICTLSRALILFKLESQLASVENDRLQLKQELSALRDEIQDQHKNVESDSQESQKKQRQLVESLRQKNKHLSHLLNDIEVIRMIIYEIVIVPLSIISISSRSPEIIHFISKRLRKKKMLH